MWRKEHLKWSAWWEIMGDFKELGSSGASASLKCGQLSIPRRQTREMGGVAAWLSWGPRAPGMGGWMPIGSERVAVALCLPSPVKRGTEEELREEGMLMEGAAGKGLVPFPGSSGVDFWLPNS